MTISNVSYNLGSAQTPAQHQSRLSALITRVNTVCKIIFNSILILITWPFRYVSSKTWSIPGVILKGPFVIARKALGYDKEKTIAESLLHPHRQLPTRQLSAEEAKAYIKPLAIVQGGHGSDIKKWIEPFGYKVLSPTTLQLENLQVEAKETCFFHRDSGFKGMLFERGDEVILTLGAIAAYESETPGEKEYHKKMFRTMNFQGVKNLLGGDMTTNNVADQLMNQLIQSPYLQGKKLVLVGGCLGGCIAQFLSLKYKVPAFCFNSLPMGPGLQSKLGESALDEADKYITHLFAKGDFLNGKSRGVIDTLVSALGLRTAGNFGRSFYIPTPYKTGHEIHTYLFGSMMHYVVQDRRVTPDVVDKKLMTEWSAIDLPIVK